MTAVYTAQQRMTAVYTYCVQTLPGDLFTDVPWSVRAKFDVVTDDRAAVTVFQRNRAAADTVLYDADADRAFADALAAEMRAYTSTVVPGLVAEIVRALRAGGSFDFWLAPGGEFANGLRAYPKCVLAHVYITWHTNGRPDMMAFKPPIQSETLMMLGAGGAAALLVLHGQDALRAAFP